MPRQDVEFKTSDKVTLRGWFYTPTKEPASGKLPCLVLSHGWTCVKEMGLDKISEYFASNLPISCLVYDQRGIGASDTGPGQHRSEIITSVQRSDLSDAITYAQSRSDVDMNSIGVWGYSYSGGHSIHVAAVDRRVKAVLALAPFVNGWDSFYSHTRPDFVAQAEAMFQEDRLKRAAGEDPVKIPVITDDPLKPAGLPSQEAYQWFSKAAKGTDWKNEVTFKSVEEVRANDATLHIAHIGPTPLLMILGDRDTTTPTILALQAFERALQPKELLILPGGHFDFFEGSNFEALVARQSEFLRKTLL